MKHKTVFFKSDKIGDGELGSLIVPKFINAISNMQADILPRKIVFLNRGVLLSTQNSQVDNKEIIKDLKILESLGVDILSCETCLDYFGVKDKILVGRVGNGMEVMQDFLSNDGVVSL